MAKRHPEHVNLERWLVSYADFITLLFAFFVVMYAISQSDLAKLKSVSESIREAFNAEAIDQQGKSSGKTLNQFDPASAQGGLLLDMPAGKSNIMAPDYEDLKRVADILEESVSYELGDADIAEKMQIIYDDRGLVVRLSAKNFFEPGAADVKPEAVPILDQMAKVLKTAKRHIRVEGHTDDLAVKSDYYPSNWELSTARAAWVVRYLIQKYKFDPRYLTVAGYAEYHPIAPNKSEEGRAKNRRIEIVVLSKEPR
ncbi:MAG TPA: OmpA family protein [Oligoflexia bacterium]|nr:OmpA family protein [Oligoflexia bacterium]